jgi:hypothetical protein
MDTTAFSYRPDRAIPDVVTLGIATCSPPVAAGW